MLLFPLSIFCWVTIENLKLFYSVTRIFYLLYRVEIHINEKKKVASENYPFKFSITKKLCLPKKMTRNYDIGVG